jgi:hypothetical protein
MQETDQLNVASSSTPANNLSKVMGLTPKNSHFVVNFAK